MDNLKNNQYFKNLGKILYYKNNHIEQIVINKNSKSAYRMITYWTLLEEIEYFQPKSFDYFVKKGLDEKICMQKTTIALIKNENDEKINYHCFNNKTNKSENDNFPFFHQNMPYGFSFFCSNGEYSNIMKYLEKKNKIKKNDESKIDKKEIVVEEEKSPIPKKKYCYLCRYKYEDYKKHIISNKHKQMINRSNKLILRIKNSFKRIVKYNDNKLIESSKDNNNNLIIKKIEDLKNEFIERTKTI